MLHLIMQRFIVNPSGDEKILPKDILVILGSKTKKASL